MRKTLMLLLAFLLALPLFAEMEAAKAPLTAAQKEADIDFLAAELAKGHYDLSALLDEAAWQALVEALRDKAPQQDDMTFSLAVIELVAQLGDSHTRAGLTGQTKEALGALPLQMMWFGDRLHLVATTEPYSAYLGQQVESIAGLSIEELMARFRGFISHDNQVWYRLQFAQQVIVAEYLRYLGIIEETQAVDVGFRGEDGNHTSVPMEVAYGDLQALSFVTIERAQVPLAQQAQQIYYTTDLGSGALLLSYHVCQEDPSLPMRDFVEQVKAQLDAGGYDKVMVDLRYNGGGNSSIFEPMIAMLGAQKEELGYDLYTMIGESTFSSALMNAVQLQKRAGATLVGGPTGGSVNHYGEIVNVELPNAEVIVTYSTKFFEMIPGYGIDSLKPDILIETTYTDFIQGNDPQIAYILAHGDAA